ncbi:hypothetical protein ACVWZK_009411 [Bradyrhizobium sp. GM0.4]
MLKRLFGETAASYAIESKLDADRREMDANRMHLSSTGKVVAAPAVVGSATSIAARPATREGGGELSEW